MAKQPLKIDWLKMETEMREVLSNAELSDSDALITVSAILGWHTGRGYEKELDQSILNRMQTIEPKFFDRID